MDVVCAIVVGVCLIDCSVRGNRELAAAGLDLVKCNVIGRVLDGDILALDAYALAFCIGAIAEVVAGVVERDVVAGRRDCGKSVLCCHRAGRTALGLGERTRNRDREVALGVDDVQHEAAGIVGVVDGDVIARGRQCAEHVAAVVEGDVLVARRGD